MCDVVAMAIAFGSCYQLFPAIFGFNVPIDNYIPAIYAAILAIWLGKLDLYTMSVLSSGWQQAARLIVAHHWAVAWVWLLQFVTTGRVGPAVPFLALATIGWVGDLSIRALIQRGRMKRGFVERVLILHDGEGDEQVTKLREQLSRVPRVEVVDVLEPGKLASLRDPDSPAELGDLLRIIRSLEVDVVVVGMAHVDDKTYVSLGLCSEEGVRVVRVPEYYEEWAMMVPIDYVNNAWRIYGFSHQVDPYYAVVHRTTDMVLALIGLVLFVVSFIPIALAIKLTSRGPVLYTSKDPAMLRVGLRGRLFPIFKFRSMVADMPNVVSKEGEADPRITPIGRLLRATKLDELPQAWNVLIGQMSIVGPRPICASEDEEMLEQIPLYHLRRLVRPGLTGLGQVSYGSAHDPGEHLLRLQYDLYYIKHRCFALDLSIIARTLLIVVGARQRP
jgi:exopolysaccharide biosynthesis polyprenyl glycosylphosphotransferase